VNKRRVWSSLFAVLLLGAFLVAFQPTPSFAVGAVRGNAGFGSAVLPPNDDGSTGSVNIGFTANFYGQNFSSLYVNNNGNITFDFPLSTFTPFDLTSTGQLIIAPFFADVDTRAGNVVTYGTDTVDGRPAFGVNWINVGYFAVRTDKLNSFQLVMIDRSDIAPGDFDFEFNYDQIQWETGEASNGIDGLGGFSARMGFSNGTGVPGTFYEQPGSAVNGAFLDGGSNALASNSLNSTVAGRYLFQVRSGTVNVPVQEVSRPCLANPTANSVVGDLPFLTQAYYEPGKASPGIFVNPGTYWVLGVDESAEYYKIIISCQYVWVPVQNMQPNFDSVWQGRLLPTDVVDGSESAK
jgi:hypothetical protein